MIPQAHLHVVGDVAVYVFDINQLSLPTPFYFFLVSVSVVVTHSTVFRSINSPDNYPLSHSSSGFLSALSVLSTIYLFVKVSLSPDIILCGWLGLKHQLTNYSFPRGLTFTWWECYSWCFWHKPAELAHSFLFLSGVYFGHYGPFNCISFYKFSRQFSAFSLCSSGLLSALLVLSNVPLQQSLPQPWYTNL